ncbi:hypothetical protein SARC_13312, partial [Sphaeroforma arctica JP610]
MNSKPSILPFVYRYYIDHVNQKTSWNRPSAVPPSFSTPLAPKQSLPSKITLVVLKTAAKTNAAKARKQWSDAGERSSASGTQETAQGPFQTQTQINAAKARNQSSIPADSATTTHESMPMLTDTETTQRRFQSQAQINSAKVRNQSNIPADSGTTQRRFQTQAQINAAKSRNQSNIPADSGTTTLASMPMLVDAAASTTPKIPRSPQKQKMQAKSTHFGPSATKNYNKLKANASASMAEISPPNKTRLALQQAE